MSNDDLTITVSQTDEGVSAEIWCPAFVDRRDFPDADDALAWASARLEGRDPFEVFEAES